MGPLSSDDRNVALPLGWPIMLPERMRARRAPSSGEARGTTVLLCCCGARVGKGYNREKADGRQITHCIFAPRRRGTERFLPRSCRGTATGGVVRSSERIFTGTVLGVDEWEALSKDRNDYSISVLYRTGRDRHHITDLPGAVGDKQKAIAQGWQQEQSGRLSDQVSR
jgi:hypothetical protein